MANIKTNTSVASKKSWAPEDLTEEQLKPLRTQVIENIITSRVGLLIKHSFWGELATRLQISPADDWCPTAAVDGRTLYFNTQFFHKMSIPEMQFVIAHEILHCAFDHFSRRGDRLHQLYNVAGDYVNNYILVRDKIGKMPSFVNAYYDEKYKDMSSEEVYDLLFEEMQNDPEYQAYLDQLGELLDEHIEWDKPDPNNPGRPVRSAEDLAKIKDEFRESLIASAGSTAGNVPAEIQRLVKELVSPSISWRDLLKQQIKSIIKSDYTFQRPSRRGYQSGIILPGMIVDDKVDVCIAIDTSGSIIDEQLRDFLSEIKGLMDEYSTFNVRLWCFDTSIYNEQTFTKEDDDILSYAIAGGGGTNFRVNWDYMKRNDIEPKKFIMFTDMETWNNDFGDPNYCDTIFINHSKNDVEAPFGLTVKYTVS